MKLSLSGLTHTGHVRDHNEDSFWISPELGAAIVSDGMGGHAAGEVASAITVESFKKVVASRLPKATTIDDVITILSNSIGLANQEVTIAGKKKTAMRTMGATAVCACLWNETFAVANIGDSRAYLIQGGTITRLTKDDSFVQQLIDGGFIDEEEARFHPNKNIVTRHIGSMKDAVPSLSTVRVEAGYRMLLCSDGLNSAVTDEEILGIVSGAETAETVCRMLIDRTLENDAPDNVTVVVFETS